MVRRLDRADTLAVFHPVVRWKDPDREYVLDRGILPFSLGIHAGKCKIASNH